MADQFSKTHRPNFQSSTALIQHIIIISLMIVGVYTAFVDGNVLSFIRVWCANQLDKLLGKKWSRYIQKPLWDCLPCMASLWTIIFTWNIEWRLILAVCGLLAIVDWLMQEDEPVRYKEVDGFKIVE